jgi:hypothetical protein
MVFAAAVSCLASVSIVAAAGHASAASYNVIVLQDVGGTGVSLTSGINDSGQTVGFSLTATGREAVQWAPNGAGTALQDVGSVDNSQASGINASGQIAGFSRTATGSDAVLWSASTGTGKALQDVGGAGESLTSGINDSGQTVGFSLTATGGDDAVLWSASTLTGTALQDVGGAGLSVANGINASGEIASSPRSKPRGRASSGSGGSPLRQSPGTLLGFAGLGYAGYRQTRSAKPRAA